MSHLKKEIAVIIGAGPAGLTAAYELLKRTNIQPVIIEENPTYVGGLAKTVHHNGNRIDIGGHRFFSKSEKIINWWLSILPLERGASGSISYQGQTNSLKNNGSQDPNQENVMLLRKRESHIYYNNQFFSYPISLSLGTFYKLGAVKVFRIGITYFFRCVFPRRPESTLEDFYINRFGDELYRTFFRTYTEKVWGVPCSTIGADWGAQRVKGLSIIEIIRNALAKPFRRKSIDQRNVETSLIEQFLYPKYGPGQMWERVAREIKALGGEIHMGEKALEMLLEANHITSVRTLDARGQKHTRLADYVFSSMPVRDLIGGIIGTKANEIKTVSDALAYRDFITVGLLLKKAGNNISMRSDNWIYVHDPEVDVGRIQIFNNWSPFLVEKPDETVWVGLEYFCNENDKLWKLSDTDLIRKATHELQKMGLIDMGNVLDGVVIRERKAYPSYAGSYERFGEIKKYLNSITNLFPIGRNGMHRYNNQDHSMLTAMTAVDLIIEGSSDKSKLWDINTEPKYHERK